jgi:WD40 repeat protein
VLRQTPLDQYGASSAMRESARSAVQSLARFEELDMHSLDADQAVRKVIELLPSRIAKLNTGTGSIKAAGFDPSGRYAAVVHDGEHIGVWDLVEARLITSWEHTTGAGESTLAVAIATGGKYLVLSRYNPYVDTSTLTVKSLPEAARIASFQVKGRISRGLRLDPKGRYVFVVNLKNTWGLDLRSGERLQAPTVDAVINDMAFSENGAYLASVLRKSKNGKREYSVQIVDLAAGEEINRWVLPEKGISVHWSPDSTKLVVGFNNTLSRYDATSGLELDTYALPENPLAESLSEYLVAEAIKGTNMLRVSKLSGGKDVVYVPLDGELKAAAFQPAAGTLATLTVGSPEDTLTVWAIRNGRTVADISLESPLTDVAFDDVSRVLYTYSDNLTDCWRLPDSPPADGKLEQISESCATEHLRPHRALTDNPLNGSSSNVRVKVVNGTGNIVWEKQLTTTPLVAVSSVDGRLVALMQGSSTRAGMRLSIEIWDSDAQQPIASIADPDLLLDYRNKPYLTFSPDRRYLATPGRNGVIIWETDTFTKTAEIYQANVVRVALQPRGSLIAVLDGDDTIHVWDIKTSEEIARLTQVGVLSSFAVSPDGRWIVTLDAGGIAHIWAIQPKDLIAQACTRLSKPCP